MRHLHVGRLGPAWLLAVGLLLVVVGTGYATDKYVIRSTKQISPKVMKKLKGRTGPQGAAGPQGPQGAPGPQGPAGTAKASGMVVAGGTPTWGANQGFPAAPRRVATGRYCVPAPAGVNPDTTAVLVSLSGGSTGFVTQAGPPAALCRANEFEIWTTDETGDYYTDSTDFNVVVP
jgi:hypothetical protein